MKIHPAFLAFDLGAESGRLIMGELVDRKIRLNEVSRFKNQPVRLPDGLHWDVLSLWSDIIGSLKKAIQSESVAIQSVGFDSWGVDFGLLDKKNQLIGNPFHYRDNRTDGMLEEVFKTTSRRALFSETGNQFMQINTLFQLASMVKTRDPALLTAEKLLMIPDLFKFWLSGEISTEFTIATTSQCLNPTTKKWADQLISTLGIPIEMFTAIVHPGSCIGHITPWLCQEHDIPALSVVAPASHDTASAVAAVPGGDRPYAWISCGTWSIVGTNMHQPVLTEDVLNLNFTNEGAAENQWRLSKIIIGLWLVQECKRHWEANGLNLGYAELTQMALNADPFWAVIDPDDETFLKPGNMPDRITLYCKKSGQKEPDSPGQIMRIILESMAFNYRSTIDQLEKLTRQPLDTIHIVGGGVKNQLLCQFTANACRRECIAGPVEATAVGNIIIQAISMDFIPSIPEGRQWIKRSFEPVSFQPVDVDRWEEAYQTYKKITGK